MNGTIVNRWGALWVILAVLAVVASCEEAEPSDSTRPAEADGTEKASATGDTGGASKASGAFEQPIELDEDAIHVGVLIFDGVFITEYVAPYNVFHKVEDKTNVFLVGPTRDPVMTYEGTLAVPHFGFEDAPDIDILVVPSGGGSMQGDLENQELIGFVRDVAKQADWVTSHCWGAFTLAEAGVLDGKRATTFPGYFEALAEEYEQIDVIDDRRYVRDGNVITSQGGIAAFEAALALVEEIYGEEEAGRVADGLVYAPQNVEYSRKPAVAPSGD